MYPCLLFSVFSLTRPPQAVRAVAFHPSGDVLAVGSNTPLLQLCSAHVLRAWGCDAAAESPLPVLCVKKRAHRLIF